MANNTHDPSLWSYIANFLQVIGGVSIVIFGWLWSRINRTQDEVIRAHIRITETEKQLISHRAEVNKEYPTKEELHRSLKDAIKPLEESAKRTERMIDELYNYHIRKGKDQ